MVGDDSGKETSETRGEGGTISPVSRCSQVTDRLDTHFALLSDVRRRYLLYYLFTMEGKVTECDAAVDAVYTFESGDTDTDNHTSRDAIRITLHHTQLPRLADAGVIDYDRRHGTIRFTGDPALEEWVEHARHKEMD